MDYAVSIILGTLAIYCALVVLVTFSPKLSKKFITAAAVIAVVVGLVFYGICFASICVNPVLAVLKTCYAVCCLFAGENSFEAVSAAPLLQHVFFEILFEALRFLGIFATAGAAISAIGSDFLRKVRLLLFRAKPLAVIYSLTPNTLKFARELKGQKKIAVVFVAENPDPALAKAARDLDCIVYADSAALSGAVGFLSSVAAGKRRRKISLFCLAGDYFVNRKYAAAILASLKAKGVQPQQTSLTIFADENETSNAFLNMEGRYGYGSVLSVNEELISARLLMQKAPVWDAMSFDSTGRATEDFHALVLGGGKVGQAVIKQIVMNGQFAGSRFSLAVFDPKYEAVTGRLQCESSQLFEEYEIDVHSYDARSKQMYAYLTENWKKLKYIVVCTGTDESNLEISRQLRHFLAVRNSSLPVHICSTRDLQRIAPDNVERWSIYTSDVLCSDKIDRQAMLLNHAYCNNDKTPQENWNECDYFNRMSSCAAVDFGPAFLKMVGLPQDALPGDGWLSKEQLENLAIAEHARWCAFHYCMGFRCMTKEEFEERCKTYLVVKAEDPDKTYRISKDVDLRIHACLVPWDKLDDLSKAENAVTGGKEDYKEKDRKNVLFLPAIMKAAKEQ